MNVNYFFRNNKAGFSIGTVFKTIVNEAEKYIEISSFYLPSPSASILSILQNGIYALHKSHKGYHVLFLSKRYKEKNLEISLYRFTKESY